MSGHVQEDDAADSGTSFSMDESGAENEQQRSQWFPLRPSAVGEDDDDTSQVTYTASAAARSSNSDRLQNIPHAWSDDDSKRSPPERSQPDGRDGPDLKRTPWVANTYVSTQPTVAPPAQSQDLAGGAAARKDSGSDVSLISQPRSDHNITPLDVITRSVPPAKRGVGLISELKQRHAPQLNSDSDTESPVSKLLGPNFRAVQEVLDRLKKDRLTDSVSDEAEEAASEGHSLTEESIKSMASAGIPANISGSRSYGAGWTSAQPISETHPRSSIDSLKSFESLSSRLPPSHSTHQTGDRHLLDETHRRFSEGNIIANATNALDTRRVSSWTSAEVPYDPSEISPVDAVPNSTTLADKKSSTDLVRFSSAARNVTDTRIPGEYRRTSSTSGSEHVSRRTSLDDGSVHSFPSPTDPGEISAVNAVPKSTIPVAKKSSVELMRVSSAPSSATNARVPEEYRPPSSNGLSEHVLHRPFLDAGSVDAFPPPLLATSSRYSAASSATNARILGEYRPPSTTNGSEDVLHRTLLSDGSMHAFPPPLLPTPTRYSAASSATDGPFSNTMERSHDPSRTGRDQEEALQNGSSLHHSRVSDRSASSDDTDDLLTYEPVLEGDRQYLRMQKQPKLSGARQVQSGAAEYSGNKMPAELSRDIDSAARMSGKEQSASTVQSREGTRGTFLEVDDSHIKSLHWSLGAGTISPISTTSLPQTDAQEEKSSTPLGPASERSRALETATLQEQSLEEDEPSVQTEDRHVAASKQTKSRSTTDFSSSDEIYRPVLYRDGSANEENRPGENAFQTSSYGIYDIRRSSGPGSINRRRKALGLEPNPTRETPSQNGGGMVYISGSSTPSSVRDARGRPLGGVEDSTGRMTVYQAAQPELEYFERRLDRSEEPTRPKTKAYQLEREENALKSTQAREVLGRRASRDQHRDEYLVREDRRSDRSHRHYDRYSTPEQQMEPSHYSSDRPRQYTEKVDPNRTGRSTSSGKSRRRHTDDILTPSSQQSWLEKTTESRKHTEAKTRHRSHDGRDSHGTRSSRLDANISKLTSLVSKSVDESISSSSQSSVIPTSRWSSTKRRKHKMTSSSESSDASQFFNYAFMEPRLRSSIKHKIRLRELLKTVKSRDISPIVRTRDSTTTESTTSNTSTNEGEERDRVERERIERDRVQRDKVEREIIEGEREEKEPPPAITQPRLPEAFEVPFSTSRPSEYEPKCTCSRKAVERVTTPVKTRRKEDRGDGREFGLPRKRDVGVNFPTPVVTRSPSPSSDWSPRQQLEDASTQTEELVSASKVKRKTEIEPVKSQRKAVKSPLRNVEERGVISQPSPKKSDYIYGVDHREAQRKPRERLIPSQNSPDHSVKTTSDRTSRAEVPAWFLPITSKPQIEQRTLTQPKTPSKSRTSDELRVDVFDSMVNPSSSLQKLSLQEAFFYAKSKFMKRSRERVARIEQAAREKEKRKMIAEVAAEEKRIDALKTKTPPDTPKVKTPVKSAGTCVIFVT